MTVTTSTSPGISQRTNVYAERQMLKHAGPVVILDKFGVTKPMPKNKGVTIKFRRPKTFTAATTPLVEGQTPTATAFQTEDVSGSLKQYGMVVTVTDVIEDTHEDPVLNEATTQAGENIGRTMEALNWAILRAGTSVTYANGTARTDVNTPISYTKQMAVTRALKAQKAMKITNILAPGLNYATRAVEPAFVAVAHTDLEHDIRALPGFLPVAQYANRQAISEYEIGSCVDVRYILSPDLDSFANGGAATSTMVTTGGTDADVYPVIYFGKDAFGIVPLRGEGAVSPSIIPVNQKTKDDPLGQRGYVGWKAWHLCLILNDLWMHRLECSATDL